MGQQLSTRNSATHIRSIWARQDVTILRHRTGADSLGHAAMGLNKVEVVTL